MWPTENSHLLFAEHALPDAGEGETHLCRVRPFLVFYDTALYLRKDYGPREPVSTVFSLCLFFVCLGGHDDRRQPAGYGWGAGDGNCSATFGSIQVGPSSQGATLGAYRHRLRLFLPMRRTRVSGRPGLRMPRGANLAKKNRGGGLFRSGPRVQRTRLVSKDRDM